MNVLRGSRRIVWTTLTLVLAGLVLADIGGTSGPVQVGGLAGVSQVPAGGQFSLPVYTPPLLAL